MEIRLPRWSDALYNLMVNIDPTTHPLRRVDVSLTNIRLDESDLDGFVATIDLVELVGNQVDTTNDLTELLGSVDTHIINSFAVDTLEENITDDSFCNTLAQSLDTDDAVRLRDALTTHIGQETPDPLTVLKDLRRRIVTPMNPSNVDLDQLERDVKAINALAELIAYLTPATPQAISFRDALQQAKEQM